MIVEVAKLKEDTIETYQNVLNKKAKWATGYWQDSVGKERAKICTRHLCESLLSFRDHDFEHYVTKSMFMKHKLGTMLKNVYQDSPIQAVLDAFPEKEIIIFKQQNQAKMKSELIELLSKPYKNEETRKEIAEKVIKYLHCEEKEIPKKVSSLAFPFHLKEYLKEYYNSSAFRMFEEVRPGLFKPWEFDAGNIFTAHLSFSPYHSNEVPREYFKDKANRQDAVIWLLNKIRENGKKVKDLDIETVDQYGLYTLLHYYDNSLFLMLNEFFEGKTKPWIMKDTCTHEYWKSHPDIAKEGILYLIEQVGLTKETIPQLTLQHFRDHYLDKMLYSNYNGLIFSAINDVYPNEYIHLKWAFHDIPPQVFHVKENRQEAIQDLVRKMNLKKEEIPLRVTKETLLEHRFDYMLNHVHKGNVFLVINEAFPQQFNKDEFTGSTDSIEEYIDIFKKGNPSKLSFSDITEDGIKKGFAKLNEIFTVNTNSWVGQRKSQPFSEKIGELELSLYKELVKGNLSIYEFEYEEPEEPKEEGEEFIFNRLTHHSRARYSNVVWLYWRAYHFFKRFHLHLQLDSVYMGLGKEDCINTNDYEYEGDDIELETTIDRYRSIVRCGELEPYRLYSELYSGGVECVWVFPFEEEFYLDDEEVHNESSKSTKAYLLQFHHDARVSFVNKMMNKSIEPLYIM